MIFHCYVSYQRVLDFTWHSCAFFKSTWPLCSRHASMGGWWCLIPDATGIFGVGTKFGTSEQTEEKPCFFLQIQLQGGAPYYIHGVMWITPRNGRKENNIKLFHPYKWHGPLLSPLFFFFFFGPSLARHLHNFFQQYTLNKNSLCPKISIILR